MGHTPIDIRGKPAMIASHGRLLAMASSLGPAFTSHAPRHTWALMLAAGLSAACGRESSDGATGERGAATEAQPGGSEPASSAVPDRRPALVFLGDSLTAGYGLTAQEAMPELIQGEIDRAGLKLRVINAGRSADTTAGGASRVGYYLRPEVSPRALVVWLGANDIMRGVAIAEIEKNLRTIVQRARAADRSLAIYLVQMRAFPNLGADYASAFEALYPRIAESEGATLLPFPLGEVAGRPALNQADGIHPTAEGTRKVAQALWAALRPQLGTR